MRSRTSPPTPTAPKSFSSWRQRIDLPTRRLPALNIDYYHEKYGYATRDDLLGMVRAENLSKERKRLLLHGMRNLVIAFGQETGLDDVGEEDAVRQAPRTEKHDKCMYLRYRSGADQNGQAPTQLEPSG